MKYFVFYDWWRRRPCITIAARTVAPFDFSQNGNYYDNARVAIK